MPESIDPTSDRPVYRQIADQLRQAIREGRYGEGDALPSETALAETYGVTRMTARQAMDVLKGEGLVRSEHGRGVFVRSRPTVRRLARNRFTKAWRESGGTGRGAYDVEMRQLGLEPGVELVELGPVTPPSEIAERLGLKAGDKALIRRRQMYAGGQPMQLATSYVPWSFAEGTQMVERHSGPGGINTSCRVIAGCSPISGQPSSAASGNPLCPPSWASIQAKYPQLLIVDSPPTWMDEAELARMRETPLWLDEDPPQGLLRALVADRERE